MSVAVIGAGFGRTGTKSLKLALEQLGFGPCHHMTEVLDKSATQIPLWNAALAGQPDFAAIYGGYRAAVDWPTAAYWRELAAAHPDARVILSTRPADDWLDSFSGTILKVLTMPEIWPRPARPWLEMVSKLVIDRSFRGRIDAASLLDAFVTHEAAVKAAIPERRLLVFDVQQGWEPLCRFLETPAPSLPFPKTNCRQEFFEFVMQSVPET